MCVRNAFEAFVSTPAQFEFDDSCAITLRGKKTVRRIQTPSFLNGTCGSNIATMAITLYNLHRSPPCCFIRSLAKHLGIELNLKDLNFATKEHFSEDYLKINPFHKVPAIDDDGFVVYESNAIAYYLLRKYAPESDLYPTCIKTRTRIDQILACASSTIHNHSVVFVRPRVWCNSKPTDEEVRAFEEDVVRGLEHLIGEGKFAVGDKLTLADLALTAHLSLAIEGAEQIRLPIEHQPIERLDIVEDA
ncbi:hypothetical protein HPB49_020352 [Dermacentor silvarum]|uniref:Uncharacterized protein n=1 Tax=Dermacentor silvarum TaxID=543639 RepID=A0ACB8D833_DERSI|nr:hypothetical protein HPB49_020352 [Dermacentor silvarum]